LLFCEKLACLSLSGLTRQSILHLPAPQQVANAGEIKFLGNCSGNESLGEVSSLFPAMSQNKEHLKSAAKISPLILIRVFFKNSRFTAVSHFVTKSRF